MTDGEREAMAGHGRYLLQHCVYICIIGIRTFFWTKGVVMLRCRHGSNYLALSPEWTTGTGRNAILVLVVYRRSSATNQLGLLSKTQRTTRKFGRLSVRCSSRQRAETASNSPQTSKLPLHQPFSLPSSSRDTINCLGQCSSNAQLSPLQGAPLLEPLLLVHFPLPSSAVREPT